ncbi:MAG TPA: LON peptidase substrate-binding domain-containing protein [Egicoccus sp.]|nr:LON peptidase substrate-binding domain-containing protein [Egicoccus sp.]HSK21667.1 LON peptidase substrate-binding domain-containing protein [Egicoccus sp.]
MPMFPLGTVLLPHMVMPLHVFEPRYRALMHDVMAGGREFGVVLISRGHEVGGGDQRYVIGTVARVLEAEELDDGRWLVVSVGTRRIRVDRWLPDDPYPVAETASVADADDGDAPAALPDVLVTHLRRVLALQLELGHAGVPPTVDLAADPAVAVWQAAVLAPLNPLDAQRVLEADDIVARTDLLGDLLSEIEQTLELQVLQGG